MNLFSATSTVPKLSALSRLTGAESRSIREGECRSFRFGGFAVILTSIAEFSSSQNPQAGVKPLIIGQAL